ncbi:hypothetical protein [Larkinella soli]|uniref:hypothetical protein n=1 Tax=Larkinella soli TaxID=1770527 RepID=UPI000FFC1ECE|nr:hypothetical protein [Larkinella soli]
MEEKERLRKYVVDFMNRKGGYAEVAKASGISRQLLKHVDSGRNAPGVEVLRELFEKFPNEFDLLEAITGKPGLGGSKEGTKEATVYKAQLKQAEEVAAKERQEKEKERREKEEAQRELVTTQKEFINFMREVKLGKSEGVSRTPVLAEYFDWMETCERYQSLSGRMVKASA